MLLQLSLALVATILIEYGVLLLLGERRRKVLLSSVVVNILTNVPLNVYLLRCSGGWRDVLVGEVLVVVVECLWYYGFVRKWSQAAIYSLLCNAISFLTGMLFQSLLVFFNAGL